MRFRASSTLSGARWILSDVMRHSFAFLLIVVPVFFLLVACPGPGGRADEGDPWPVVQERGFGTLKALYVPAEGFADLNEEGRLTGVTVELLEDFAVFVGERYGVVLDIVFEEERDWGVFYRRVAEGGDGLIGFGNVTITEERREELTFSPPYMTNVASLISHRDAPELLSLDDLPVDFAGRTALAFEGTLHEKRLRKLIERYYPDAGMARAHSNDEIVERVAAGDNYFAYIDLYNYRRATERGAPLKRHGVADEAAEQFGYIMPLETSWEGVIDAYFMAGGGLTGTERYREIMERHLGAELAAVLMGAADSF